MKKKLLYTGVAAALLFSGFHSNKTFAADTKTDLKKSMGELRNVNGLSKNGFNIGHLDVGRMTKDHLLSTNRSTNSFRPLADDSIQYEQEPNNAPELANPMLFDVGEVGDFSYNPDLTGDVDLYQVTVDQPGDLFLGGVVANVVDGLTNIEFGLVDENLNLITTEDDIYYDPDTNITYEVMPNLAPGNYYVVALNKDMVVSSDQYLLLAEMIDKTPPPAPHVNPIDDNDKVITGTAEPDSLVFNVYGAEEALVDVNGNFKISLEAPLKAGTKLSFIAEDISGNDSAPTPVTVMDKTPPAAPKVNPIDDNDKVLSGKAEANSKVTIKKGSQPYKTVYADKFGNFKLSITPLKAGTKLYFTATDKSNNVSKVTTAAVADKTPPATLTVNKVYKTSTYVSGKTEAKVYVTVKVGSKTIASGKSDSKGYFKLKIKSQKRSTVLTVIAKDSAGNAKTVHVTVR